MTNYKKYIIGIIVLICILLLNLDSIAQNIRWMQETEAILNQTMEKMLIAAQSEDKQALLELFSKTLRKRNEELDKQADVFLAFFEGDIVGFGTSACVSDESVYEDGKKRKVGEGSYWIQTSEKNYYVAIHECTVDTFNKDNVGVISIYIIEADKWTEDYIYRGDGNWKSGINIDMSVQ